MNLDALFDPSIFSRFLKELPKATDGQYEGFNYLGMGNIILLAGCILLIAKKHLQIRLQKRDILILIACLIFTLVALSPTITFWNRTLLVIKLPDFIENIYKMFRSTGRFFWPVFYFLVIGMLGLLLKQTSTKQSIILLTLIVTTQFIDITPLIQNVRTQTDYTWKNPLKNEFWEKVPDYFTEVIIYPAEYLRFISYYEPVAHIAANNHLTLNIGYMARWPEEAMIQYAEVEFNKMLNGQGKPETLFLIMGLDTVSRINSEEVILLNIDQYTTMFTRNNPLLKNWSEWQNYEVQADQ